MNKNFHGIDIAARFEIAEKNGYGVSLAVSDGSAVETFCVGSGRFGQDFPVNPEMLFQAGSVSKPAFAMTLLRFADRGEIDLDADISAVVSDFAEAPLTFSALLSHTAGFNVHGFDGYPAAHAQLSLEDVLAGRGNSPRVQRVLPAGQQFVYSGGGITLAELAFTRITGMTLQDAFAQEIAAPLVLCRTGFFQPLGEDMVQNAAFGGRLGKTEDAAHGYHQYPEHAAAGLWTTPAELTKIGIALGRSYREGGLLKRETAVRMAAPVLENYGLCLFRQGGAAWHEGCNEGFLTLWMFSLTDDFCVAGMVNRDDEAAYRNLWEVLNPVFARQI